MTRQFRIKNLAPQRKPEPERKPRSRFTRQRPYRATLEEKMREPREIEMPWWVE